MKGFEMDKVGNVAESRGVMAELNSLVTSCPPAKAQSPSLVPPEGMKTVGPASSRIKRYYLAQMGRLILYERLVAARAEVIHQRLAFAQYQIMLQIFETQVWLMYPELVDIPIEVYDGWMLGPKASAIETLATARRPRSTRDISLAKIRE
ncbi:MAG: hypothetical protein Q8L52_02225 [bacterium]|nr:hypothetical protein [bacterium]